MSTAPKRFPAAITLSVNKERQRMKIEMTDHEATNEQEAFRENLIDAAVEDLEQHLADDFQMVTRLATLRGLGVAHVMLTVEPDMSDPLLPHWSLKAFDNLVITGRVPSGPQSKGNPAPTSNA